MTTLPPSYADCLEIWELQPPGTLRACTGIALPFIERRCQLLRLYWEFSVGSSSPPPPRRRHVMLISLTCLLEVVKFNACLFS